MTTLTNAPLPILLAGPIVRHCDFEQINFWLVTSRSCSLRCHLINKSTSEVLFNEELTTQCQQVQIGQSAFIQLISIPLKAALTETSVIEYDIQFIQQTSGNNKNQVITTSLSKEATHIYYNSDKLPNFVVSQHTNNLLHGSCRKPHFPSKDGLATVDDILVNTIAEEQIQERPSLLMMSGDQVYCDDVAGPMLVAIHQLIDRLGLYDEGWKNPENENMTSSGDLLNHEHNYYQRTNILPKKPIPQSLFNKLYSGKAAPIFSSISANNHLITSAEMFAMYLLVWSPTPWSLTNIEQNNKIHQRFKPQYEKELVIINQFIETLPNVSRAMAHIPCYMIFDDHDITDDWNLTRGWEEAAYNHPFSKRIIGNALLAYFLCQGWGNAPKNFNTLLNKTKNTYTDNGLDSVQHNELIDELYQFDGWHYQLNTTPKIVVLNTRTNRWRSESNANKPSGLMDWESLCALQVELINQPSVIMVSPAPIYGIKIIETIQRTFTFFGQPLAVDAENWMAHKGTANVILNIFRHHKTPPHFIILSGDVHYSFVYQITHRFIRTNSTIIQITCSGIKNAFPDTLIKNLERLNYYLYGRYSPLNWFTKRRRMRISEQKPSHQENYYSPMNNKESKSSSLNFHKGKTYNSLYNGSGIGQLVIKHNHEVEARVLTVENEMLVFNTEMNINKH